MIRRNITGNDWEPGYYFIVSLIVLRLLAPIILHGASLRAFIFTLVATNLGLAITMDNIEHALLSML